MAIVDLQEAKLQLGRIIRSLLDLAEALGKVGLNQMKNSLIEFANSLSDITELLIQEAINKIVYREREN